MEESYNEVIGKERSEWLNAQLHLDRIKFRGATVG